MQLHIEAVEHLRSDQPHVCHDAGDAELESLLGRLGHFTFGDVKSNDCEMMTFMISLEPP